MKLKWSIAVITVIALAVGIFALAAEYGTQSDPLVSLSYITDVFKPSLLREAESAAKSIANETQATVDKFDSQITSKINEFSDRNTAEITDSDINAIASSVRDSIPNSTADAPFATVTLAAGKTLTLSDGCEVLVRSGSVSVSSSSSTAMIDTTNGGALSDGGVLSANHLYLVSGGCSIRASSAATILIAGDYK